MITDSDIYKDLIRFGPSFQNLREKLFIAHRWIDGLAWGGSKTSIERIPDLLGTPFPFDAAMQAACVWGQFSKGIVAFPVGFSKRVIYQKTQPETAYRIHLAVTKEDVDRFLCDGWIQTLAGSICESFYDLEMKDLSHGRLKVPSWVRHRSVEKP